METDIRQNVSKTKIGVGVKNLLSFLSYHNAVPAALVVLALGAGGALAATTTGVLPLPTILSQPEIPQTPEPVEVDVSALLSVNPDAFDFRPTVTAVVETSETYTVSYALRTLAPDGGAWATYEKTGEFSVAKDALGDTGLQGYVVAKLRDLENKERGYLARAQEAEKRLADARAAQPANAFAALIGLALNQIHVPVVEKPVPEPQPQTPPVQESASTQTIQTVTADFATSTAVSTSDATSTESADITTTTDAVGTTTQASDATPSTSASSTTATSTTPTEQDTGSPVQTDSATTTSPSQ